MKKIKLLSSTILSVSLLASCDVSHKEIEQKAQAYTKAEHGFSVTLKQVNYPDQSKDIIGPKTRIASVQQVEEPHLQFEVYLDGRFSPKVNNDNYKTKKEAYELQEKFHIYNKEKGNDNAFRLEHMETGEIVLDKKQEKEIEKKHPTYYATAVFRSTISLDENNPDHVEKIAALTRHIQEFNNTIENKTIRVEDITIQGVFSNIPVDYLLTAQEVKQAIEKKDNAR